MDKENMLETLVSSARRQMKRDISLFNKSSTQSSEHLLKTLLCNWTVDQMLELVLNNPGLEYGKSVKTCSLKEALRHSLASSVISLAKRSKPPAKPTSKLQFNSPIERGEFTEETFRELSVYKALLINENFVSRFRKALCLTKTSSNLNKTVDKYVNQLLLESKAAMLLSAEKLNSEATTDSLIGYNRLALIKGKPSPIRQLQLN